MTTTADYQILQDSIATLRAQLANVLSSQLNESPQLAEEILNQINALEAAAAAFDASQPPPPDLGLAALAGVGDETAATMGETRLPPGVEPYDDTVTSERILGVGDLYYIFQHEKVGIFRVMLKLQEMFKSGVVRLATGAGAFGLYRYDRRQVLRYTQRDRLQAYRRVFGYTRTAPATGAVPNREFHTLLVNFMTQVARYFRDKRISEVIRPNADRATFGSIAVVRRAGLDLRNNLKHASYGHVNVLRVEVLQLLDEAFRILGSNDVINLYGADNAWDVVEEVMRRHMNQPQINASPRNRMAIAGREVLYWLAQPHVLNSTRVEFESLLTEIADPAEEWLTSAESLGVVRGRTSGMAAPAPAARPAVTSPSRELDLELN